MLVWLPALTSCTALQVRAGCVPSLVALLTQGHMALAVEASGALSMITVAIEGKYALHVLQEARVFVELLDWCNEQLELNLLSIISNSAEYSCMRTLLVVCRPRPRYAADSLGLPETCEHRLCNMDPW